MTQTHAHINQRGVIIVWKQFLNEQPATAERRKEKRLTKQNSNRKKKMIAHMTMEKEREKKNTQKKRDENGSGSRCKHAYSLNENNRTENPCCYKERKRNNSNNFHHQTKAMHNQRACIQWVTFNKENNNWNMLSIWKQIGLNFNWIFFFSLFFSLFHSVRFHCVYVFVVSLLLPLSEYRNF